MQKYLDTALHFDNTDDDALITLGDLAMKAKDYRRASDYYRRVVWIECDLTGFKNLNPDRTFGTPTLLKLASGNHRLQYRLATDGYIRPGEGSDGVGDIYFALQYLFRPQEKVGWDLAGRVTAKISTAGRNVGGTQKFDVRSLLLASRDFTRWQFHGDFNLGFLSLTRTDAPGVDCQVLAGASTTTPIKGGRWQYSNENDN